MGIKAYEDNGRQLWSVHVKSRDARGKQVNRKKRGIVSQAKAKRIELDFRVELLRLKDCPSAYKWGQWLEVVFERMRMEFRASTVENYRRSLEKWTLPALNGMPLQDIKKRHVHSVVFEGMYGVSDLTRQNLLKRLRRVFNMAIEEELITHNPTAGLKVKVAETRQLCFNHEEIRIFLSAAYKADHPFKDIWSVGLLTGMRSGEMIALTWADVDFENGYLSVNKSWTKMNGLGPTKSSHTRSVPISKELERLLKSLKLKSESEYVLPRINDWLRGEQAKVMKEFCRQVGVTEIRFHDLRATFITQLLLKDVPLAKVMKIVGHASIKTTQKYLRLIAKDVQGATEALGIEVPDVLHDGGKVVSLF